MTFLDNISEKTTEHSPSFKSFMRQVEEQWNKAELPIPFGIDQNGNPHLGNLKTLGNIIMGGSTGSGKSIFNHNLICSLVLKYNPSDLRLFLADPKRVEFPLTYERLPHVLGKVYMDLEEIITQLLLLKKEIEIKKYPNLVIVIDTFSDLMAYDSDRFESVISSLSKLNDKGVYMVICDSRTGKDVFSPKIMSCFPTRIAFNTSNAESSKLLIRQSGAEKLKGAGDMLFLEKGEIIPKRYQGSFIDEKDIFMICDKI